MTQVAFHENYGHMRSESEAAPLSPTNAPLGFLTALAMLVFLAVSLVPASYGRYFPLTDDVDIYWHNLLLFAFFGLLLGTRILYISRWRITSAAWWKLLVPFVALGVWQLLSISWNDREPVLRAYSALQSVNMIVAVTSGVLLISGMAMQQRQKLILRLSLIFVAVGIVYMLLSFAFPSLRPSHEWRDRTATGLGFIRVHGPLGTSTTLLYVLSIVLGFGLGNLMGLGSRRWGLLITIFGGLMLLGTGSRGGLLCFGILALCLGYVVGLGRWLALVAAVVVIGGMAFAFTGIPERYLSFEDRARAETYRTAMNALFAEPEHFAIGVGHGELYSKLHDDTRRKQILETRWYLLSRQTEYGWSLRNSHSVFIRTLAETGLIGLLLLMIPVSWILLSIVRARRLSRYNKQALPAMAAVCGAGAALAYMCLDEFFVSSEWLVVLFVALTVGGLEWCRDVAIVTKDRDQDLPSFDVSSVPLQY